MSEPRRLFSSTEVDPHDPTFQVHSEAMRDIERQNSDSQQDDEDIQFTQINERIYLLLLKNVSRDCPLSPVEVQYLRTFRSSMSGEQWQRWLSYARSERKRLKETGQLDKLLSGEGREEQKDDRFHEKNTNEKIVTLSLADAIDAASGNKPDNDKVVSQQSLPSMYPPQPVADASRRGSVSHMTNIPGNNIDTTIGEPIDGSASRRSIPPSLGHQKENTQASPQIPATAVSRRIRQSQQSDNSSNRMNLKIPISQHEDIVMSTPAATRSFVADSTGIPQRYSVLEATPVMLSQQSNPQTDGVSTLKPTGLRAQSAPRLRPTTPSNLSVSTNPPQAVPMEGQAPFYTKPNSSSPSRFSSYSSRIVDENIPIPPTFARPGTYPFDPTSQTHSNSSAAVLPPPPYLTSPGRAVADYVTKHQQQRLKQFQDYHDSALTHSEESKELYTTLHKNGRHPDSVQQEEHSQRVSSNALQATTLIVDDLREALESAQIGSNRIDNACTAARYLINSLHSLSNQVDPNTNQNLEKSKNVLEEMLKSLEKSKVNFGRIEDTVTKNLKVEDLHHHQHHATTSTSQSRQFHRVARDASEDYINVADRDVEGHLHSDEYLRFQPLADDLQSLHSHHTKQSGTPSNHRFLGGSQSSILRRSASLHQQSQYDDENNEDNEFRGNSSQQLMWSPARSFRGGQRVLVENYASSSVAEGRNQAQNTWGLVTRVCVNRGPLVKAYEEFPIRLDMEAMTMDIVWRESRVDLIRGASLSGTSTSATSQGRGRSVSAGRHMRPTAASTASAAVNYYQPIGGNSQDLYDMESQRILRRERFQFDAMYIGLTADRKLQEYVRFRTRAAMEKGTNVVFLCNACGETVMGELEAPVTIALGSGGGSGIATNILQEAFKYVAAHNATYGGDDSGTDSYVLRSAVQNQYLSTRMAKDNRLSSISLSAILVNGNTVVDMLSNATQQGRHGLQPRIQRKSSGEVNLTGVTTLDLSNVMDFERIIGLLLGRRTGINETMQSFQVNPDEVPLASYATWTTSSVNPAAEKLRRLDLNADVSSTHENLSSSTGTDLPSSSSTMILSFRIALGSSLMPKRVIHIRIVCPCGKDWSLPNFDLSVLSESIGALPHSPPEGLLAVSPLTMLLTDLTQQPSTFVSVVHVNRVEAKRRHMRVATSDHDIAMTALNSMRVSCLAR